MSAQNRSSYWSEMCTAAPKIKTKKTYVTNLWCLCLYLCCTDMVAQALELSNQPHVVVATPGRLADHIRSSNTFNLSKIQFLVSVVATRTV